jgi:hypothetical protein
MARVPKHMGSAVSSIFSWCSWQPEFTATVSALFTYQWELCLSPVQGKCITGQSTPTGYVIDAKLPGSSSFVCTPVNLLLCCQTIVGLVEFGLAFG